MNFGSYGMLWCCAKQPPGLFPLVACICSCIGWLGNLYNFPVKIIILGTLNITGSEHRAPFNRPLFQYEVKVNGKGTHKPKAKMARAYLSFFSMKHA